MTEYISDAIVLKNDPQGEHDLRISLFTKRFGKFAAKAKSVRKIKSKLAGHLDLGNVAQVRIIEKNGLQVVDALKTTRLAASPHDLGVLSRLLPEAEPDPRLWAALMDDTFRWPRILHLLGWDPAYALCRICGRGKPEFFEIQDQEFVCHACTITSRIPQSALLYMVHDA